MNRQCRNPAYFQTAGFCRFRTPSTTRKNMPGYRTPQFACCLIWHGSLMAITTVANVHLSSCFSTKDGSQDRISSARLKNCLRPASSRSRAQAASTARRFTGLRGIQSMSAKTSAATTNWTHVRPGWRPGPGKMNQKIKNRTPYMGQCTPYVGHQIGPVPRIWVNVPRIWVSRGHFGGICTPYMGTLLITRDRKEI